jgi:hypothetical protein
MAPVTGPSHSHETFQIDKTDGPGFRAACARALAKALDRELGHAPAGDSGAGAATADPLVPIGIWLHPPPPRFLQRVGGLAIDHEKKTPLRSCASSENSFTEGFCRIRRKGCGISLPGPRNLRYVLHKISSEALKTRAAKETAKPPRASESRSRP